jgi:hypothetical protein
VITIAPRFACRGVSRKPETLKRMEHEYALREELDSSWAVRPLAIARHWDRTVLVLEDPCGEPLDQMVGQPMDLGFSLRQIRPVQAFHSLFDPGASLPFPIRPWRKPSIPYSTLAQAFQGLIRPLLGKNDAELSEWRDAFRDALGPNGQLIVDLIPEPGLILGRQPPVPDG